MKKIERMKLGELKMNPSNPRTISEGQLKKLIVSLLVFPEDAGDTPDSCG